MGKLPAQCLHAADLPELSGLSRRVLRHLIIRHDLPVGSRILDVGCGEGRLVHFLHQLGFEVTGVDESRAAIDAARRLAPYLDLRHGRADELALCCPQAFDVVLVRGFSAYDGDLFSARALETTANLLSCLRPGRLLVFLARTGEPALLHNPRVPGPAAHSLACYDAHLAAFPGHAETAVLPDSYARPGTWKSLLAGRRPTGYLTSTFQIAAQQRTHDDWLKSAQAAARLHRPRCCQPQQASRPAA